MNMAPCTWQVRLVGVVTALAFVCTAAYAPFVGAAPAAHAQATATLEAPGPLLTATVAMQAASHATAASTAAIVPTSAATAASTGIQTTIMKVLNGLAWTVAKVAIQSITKSLVTWINSGFKGEPAFATNLDASLMKVSDFAAQQFITQLTTNGAVKSPYQSQVASTVNTNYLQSTSANSFFTQNPYTLNKVAANDTAFLGGNFSQGGWTSWVSAFAHPANNPYGAYQQAYGAVGTQTSHAQANQLTELNWAKGFNSFRGTCPSNGVPGGAAGAITNGIGSLLNNASGGAATTCQAGQTAATNPACGSAPPKASPVASLSTTANTCPNQSITTPGSVIESQLETQLGTGVRQLELANSINEIVGALAAQLVNQVLGPNGLAGLSKPAAGGGTSALTQATAAGQYTANAATLAQGISQNISTSQTQLLQYQANLQTIGQAAQNAATACANNPTALAQAQQVLTAVTQPLQNASTTLAMAGQLQYEAAASAQTTDPNLQGAAISSISTDYQTFIASPTYPSTNGMANAAAQSLDSSATPGASTTLYTAMNQLAQSCAAATTPVTTTTATTTGT